MVIVTTHQYVQHTTVGTSAVGLSRIERKRRVRRSEHQKRCAKGGKTATIIIIIIQ
jgi:hypothetical protein